MRILILYHNACSDGSFAAATVSLAFPMDEVHFVALDYVQPNGADIVLADGTPLHLHPEIRSYDRLYFVDFACSERQLADLTAYFKNELYVFDHHDVYSLEKYREACNAIPVLDAKSSDNAFVQPSNNVIFASKSSGVMLAYFGVLTHFSPSSARVMAMIGNLMRIVQLVSDRDTWQTDKPRAFAFYDGYSKEMFADKEESGVIMDSVPSTVAHARSIILNGDIEKIIEIGYERIRERNEHIEKLYNANGCVFEPNELIPQRHAIMSSSRAIGSDAAQWVRDNVPDIKLVLIVRCAPKNAEPDKVFCSVRSDADSEYNARMVAQSFGGSGHPTASGCVIPRETFDKFYPRINPDYKQVQL